MSVCFLSKLCGRAGRGGLDSRAHVFYSGKQKKVDAKVKEFCVSKENCRRREMLKCVGSDEVGRRTGLCCDMCSGLDCIGSQLRFETRAVRKQMVPSERKRPRAKKKNEHLTAQLKSALLLERTRYITQHPGYRILGPQMVCPDCVINHVCKIAHSIESEADLSRVNRNLRPYFFKVIQDCLSTDSSSKRSRIV